MTQPQFRFIAGAQTPERQRLAVDAFYALRNAARTIPHLVEDAPHWHDATQLRLVGTGGQGDPTGIRGFDISDPTLAGAMRNERVEADQYRVLALMILVAENVKELSRLMGQQRRVGDAGMLEQAAKAARCTGGQGEAWAVELGRPECVNNQVADGLCAACYQSRRRWRRGREHAAVAAQQMARGGVIRASEAVVIGEDIPPYVLPADTEATASVHKLVVDFHDQWKDAG